ncbi:hypothetical protein A9306_09725 [Moraxella atlantae]|uniref:Transcriptional regulator n=1 Tax=Faucicola atlantae TaxID=34059 RepID=A0A1B8QC20_9GAMM|nr:hypothetical protein A9306_09725 [Moraxella atlantae]
MEINFVEELKRLQSVLKLNQRQMCELLYNVPLRTYQSWLLGEKLPPEYYQQLILFKVQSNIENIE